MSQEQGDSRYLYEQIYSTLKEEILSGRYKKGDWFPPERVLKERFGTTHLTVRNALAKLVLEGYIERYSGKGTIVIFARSPRAVPRKTLRFPWAHVLLGELDEMRARFLESLETRMRSLPLPVRVSCHHGDPLMARSLQSEAAATGALLVLEAAGPAAPDSLDNTILIQTLVEGAACPQVVVDDIEGGRRAARHLLAAGHTQIALIAQPAAGPHEALYQALLEELPARHLPAESVVSQPCGPGVEAATSAARAVLARHGTCRAFLCGSDEAAAGVWAALRGITPADGAAAVIGYGNTSLARALQLTSIDPCVDRQAELVVACVREGMSQGALPAGATSVIPELVIRQ